MTTLNINGKPVNVEAEPETPLLWVLRSELKLVGTNSGAAGACAARARCIWTDSRCGHASRPSTSSGGVRSSPSKDFKVRRPTRCGGHGPR